MTDQKPEGREYVISRDEELDIKIKGWLVAENVEKRGTFESTRRIFITEGGKFVLTSYWKDSTWGDKARADVYNTVSQVVEALRDDEGLFGRVEKELLKEAAQNSEEFTGADVIVIP